MRNDHRIDLVEMMIWRLWGKPYRWGGDDPVAGFDCSGGVLEILKSIGLWPAKGDATAQQIYDYFRARNTPLDVTADPVLGTLCFFGAATTRVTHIGIAMNDELFFEFGGGDHTTTTVDAAVKQNAYGRIRPLDSRRDLVAFILPSQLAP